MTGRLGRSSRLRSVLGAAVLLVVAGACGGHGPPRATGAPATTAAALTDIAVTVGPAPRSLPGVLTVPAGEGRHPAVVVLGGSGPTDRDGTVGASKPLKDIADGLAAQGIAVLRYDKRPRTYPADFAARTGVTVKDEYLDDAVAALDLLRQRPEVDPNRLFVLGHSLGAVVAPRVAVAVPAVAGLVLMAAPIEDFGDGLVRQVTYLAGTDGAVTPDDQVRIDQARRDADDIHALAAGMAAPSGQLPYGLPGSYWADLYANDPVAIVRRLPQRVLLLQGGRDYQVRPDDLDRWQAALAGRPGVTATRYPAANHLFIDGEGPPGPAEYSRPGHVEAAVVNDIAAWIAAG